MTVGTQAAVLAGLDITMFIEFTPAHDSEWVSSIHNASLTKPTFVRVSLCTHHPHPFHSISFPVVKGGVYVSYFVPRVLKFFYYITIVSAFCANILVVGQTSILSVMGASLALRGPDGSMMVATDGLYEERSSVFLAFGYGLGLTISSVVLCVWLLLTPEAALVCMGVTIFTSFKMYSNYLRVRRRFGYDESETVDFTDIFAGLGDIRVRRRKLGRTEVDHDNARNEGGDFYSEEDGSSSSSATAVASSSQRMNSVCSNGKSSRGAPRKRRQQHSKKGANDKWSREYNDYERSSRSAAFDVESLSSSRSNDRDSDIHPLMTV